MTQKEEILEAARTIDGLIKVYGFKGKNLEALVRAKFALEKQIPKKPTDKRKGLSVFAEDPSFGYHFDIDYEYFVCPTCGSYVEHDDTEGYMTEIIPTCQCGQRLDWSEL